MAQGGDDLWRRDAAATVRVALPVSPATGEPFSLTLERLARPDLQAVAKKQCDLWAFVWASTSVAADLVASVVVARGATAHGATAPPPLRLLELGAGAGLASLAAARCGAAVVATDLVPDALELLVRNARANAVAVSDDAIAAPRVVRASSEQSGCLTTRQLDFTRLPALTELAGSCCPFDVVLGADVLYLSSHVRPLLQAYAAALLRSHGGEAGAETGGGGGGVGLLVDPGRTNRDDLEALAPEYGVRVLRRVDIAALPTPVARMKECTIFVLALDADPVLLQHRTAASGVTSEQSTDPGAGGRTLQPQAAFGYTLPVVK
jgi:predicted nicotinamide N-methyase